MDRKSKYRSNICFSLNTVSSQAICIKIHKCKWTFYLEISLSYLLFTENMPLRCQKSLYICILLKFTIYAYIKICYFMCTKKNIRTILMILRLSESFSSRITVDKINPFWLISSIKSEISRFYLIYYNIINIGNKSNQLDYITLDAINWRHIQLKYHSNWSIGMIIKINVQNNL